MSPRLRRLAAMLCLAALSAANLGCSGGFDTPEACFAAAKEAVANKDPLAFVDCVTEESQQTLAGSMVFMGGMIKMMSGMAALGGPQASEQAKQQFAELNAVLERHGVTEDALKDAVKKAQGPPNPEAVKAAGDIVDDKRVFIAEMIGAMDKIGQGGPTFAEKFSEEFVGDLKDVTIDGDQAKATLVTAAKEQPIEFRQNAHGWKLHITMNEIQGAGGAAPAGPLGPAFAQ